MAVFPSETSVEVDDPPSLPAPPNPLFALPGFATDVKTLSGFSLIRDLTTSPLPTYELRLEWLSTSKTANSWDPEEDDDTITPRTENPGPVPCDGGCRRMLISERCEQFGLCDHNVCYKCLAAAGNRRVCCHPDCLSMAPSTQRFVLRLRLIVFSMKKGALQRKEIVSEADSKEQWRGILASLVPDLVKEDGTKVFYTEHRHVHRKHLKSLEENKALQEISKDGETVTIVVVRKGVDVFG